MSVADDEVKRITAEVNALMVNLQANVDVLKAMLGVPDVPPEADERLAVP